MFGIWKPTSRPIKLQCRIKNEIEHLMPTLIAIFGLLGITAFLVSKLGLIEFIKVALIAAGVLIGVCILAIIIVLGVMFLFEQTLGRAWNWAFNKAGVTGYRKMKVEQNIAGILGSVLVVGLLIMFVGMVILIVLDAGIWSLVEAFGILVLCILILAAAVALALVAYKVIGFLWEQFWVRIMGCPSKEEKEELKRKWAAEEREKRRAAMKETYGVDFEDEAI